jgi:hypothetical protein
VENKKINNNNIQSEKTEEMRVHDNGHAKRRRKKQSRLANTNNNLLED